MEILQNDIFGEKHQTKTEKTKKSTTPVPKEFLNITLQSGLNELNAINNAMLIHRLLQRKLIYSGLNIKKQKLAFIKIIKNELKIKSAKSDPVTSVRDSLLQFFLIRNNN